MIFAYILLGFCLIMFILFAINKIFKPKWTCKVFGWPNVNGTSKTSSRFDGCSFHAICSKCVKEVMQDSQGNWF